MLYLRSGRRSRNGFRRWRTAAFLVGLLALLAALAPLPARAQQIDVAILGVQEIMRESSAAKAVLAEIQRREAALKAEVQQRENALLAADQELAQQRGTLSAEEIALKRSELAQQAAEVRKYAQNEQAAIAELARRGETEIREAMRKVVEQIAKEKGIELVLNKAQVVLFPGELDITTEVMQQLNAQMPSMNLN